MKLFSPLSGKRHGLSPNTWWRDHVLSPKNMKNEKSSVFVSTAHGLSTCTGEDMKPEPRSLAKISENKRFKPVPTVVGRATLFVAEYIVKGDIAALGSTPEQINVKKNEKSFRFLRHWTRFVHLYR